MRPYYANPKQLRARFLGTVNGRKVFSWPVTITIGELASLTQEHRYPKLEVRVTAHTAQDAADNVTQDVGQFACTEINVWGPKAGLACKRFWGWDRAIYRRMIEARHNGQLSLPLNGGAQ